MHSIIVRRDNFLRFFCVSLWFLLTTAGVDFYSILGVPKNVASKDLTRAYRKLAVKWHPDKHSENKAFASEKFMEIRKSYEFLKDPLKRRTYDLMGSEMQTRTQPQQAQEESRKTYGFSKEFIEMLLNFFRHFSEVTLAMLLLIFCSSIIVGL